MPACPEILRLFLIGDVDAESDHDHSDDVLGAELFVKQKSGEDDSQNWNQGVVDGNLADGMYR